MAVKKTTKKVAQTVIAEDKFYTISAANGKVVEVISGKMIVAEFSVGKKTLLSSHPKLHKLSSEGGKA